MPTDPDAIDLMRTLRPDADAHDPDAPHARAALERILATPPPAPRRRWALRLVAVPAAAAVVAAAVALVPAGDGAPDVLANAAAALAKPDVIWHFKTQGDGLSSGNSESWASSDGRKRRELGDLGGGSNPVLVETVLDFDTKTHLVYVAERNEIIRNIDPEWDFPAEGPRSADEDGPFDIVDLAHVLERARNGDDRVKLDGEATIRGIPTYELRVDIEVPVPSEVIRCHGGPKELRYTRVIYVDQARYLPVRIVEEGRSWAPEARPEITDYLEFKALPRTPATEKLLEMSPHPGAKEQVQRASDIPFRCVRRPSPEEAAASTRTRGTAPGRRPAALPSPARRELD